MLYSLLHRYQAWLYLTSALWIEADHVSTRVYCEIFCTKCIIFMNWCFEKLNLSWKSFHSSGSLIFGLRRFAIISFLFLSYDNGVFHPVAVNFFNMLQNKCRIWFKLTTVIITWHILKIRLDAANRHGKWAI